MRKQHHQQHLPPGNDLIWQRIGCAVAEEMKEE